MTEYDYSPEAYERYLATQTRIANWVDKTEQHRPQFQPAVPSGSPPDPSMRPRHPSYDSHSKPKLPYQQQQPRQLFIHPPSPESESSDDYGDGPGPMPLPNSGMMFPLQQQAFYHSTQPMGHPMISPPPMIMPQPQTYMMPPHRSSRPHHRSRSSRSHSRSHSLHTPAYYSMAPPLVSPGYQYQYPPSVSGQPGYFVMQPQRGNQVPLMYL